MSPYAKVSENRLFTSVGSWGVPHSKRVSVTSGDWPTAGNANAVTREAVANDLNRCMEAPLDCVGRHDNQMLSIHLIDGTYELFRQFYGRRRFEKNQPSPFGAVAGVLHSILEMIEKGAT